jgi:hypothetical protein
MQRTGRKNLFWPLLVIAGGLVAMLLALEVFPPAIADLIRRGWPALLVIVGLTLLLDQIGALKRWGPILAVAVAVVLVGGIIAVAYTTRAQTERTENTVTFDEELPPEVDRVRIVVAGLQTDTSIRPGAADSRRIQAEFAGSTESDVETSYEVQQGVATFILRETRPGSVPSLEAIGRGRIVIQLPMGVPLELDVQVADVRGPAVLSLLGLDVARLNVNIGRGDLLLTLPNTGLERRGEVVLTGGSVEVVVPDDLGIQLSTGGKTPTFAEGAYLLDPSANAYLSRRYDDFAETTELGLTVSGAIRLE